jgi:two-component system LytT family sensor kinase
MVGLAFCGVELIAGITEGRPASAWTILSNNLIRVYIWGAMSPLVWMFAKRFVVDPRRLRFFPLSANALFGVFLALLFPWIYTVIAWFTNPGYFAALPSLGLFIIRQLVFSWYTLISLWAPTFLSVEALLFLRGYRNEEAKNAALLAEVSRAQLNALKMQLQPHFLFNSMHAISSLILVDPARANRMVALLGDFLRQTLDHSDDQIVRLEEELEFLRCYLAIEETRFEDRLSVKYDIAAGTLDANVPQLILQPLVENAVKHGIAPFATPGQITIKAWRDRDELRIMIANSSGGECDAAGTNAGPKKGLGIANVRSRLDQLYGVCAHLAIRSTPGRCEVELGFPFKTDRTLDQRGGETN